MKKKNELKYEHASHIFDHAIRSESKTDLNPHQKVRKIGIIKHMKGITLISELAFGTNFELNPFKQHK